MFYHNNGRKAGAENRSCDCGDKKFTNFDFLHEGDTDPALGKKIEVLVENGGDFIVYLDPEMNIQYAVSPAYNSFSPFYGMVLNKVAELEGLADRSFMTGKQIKEYRSMIGAAIARMYEHENGEVIFGILNKAEYFLKSRVTETAKIWYLSSASSAVVLLVFLYFMFFSVFLHSGSIGFFASGIIMGAAGAYLSLIMNSKKINVNPSSGRTIHFFESITRLLIGMIGGLFTSLVFYSGMLNIGNDENRFFNVLVFSFTAGFSERMVPNLIHQFENSPSSCKSHENGSGGK